MMLNLILSLLSLCWHYVICIPLLILVFQCKKRDRTGLAYGLAALCLLVSTAGFFLVFHGPFVESGKTFGMYLTRYGLYTLPIFLVPAAAFAMVLWKKK